MDLSQDQVDVFNVALNEATLIGAEVSADRRLAGITLSVMTLPEVGPPPGDRRVQLVLHQVGRVAASLRHGRWDDENAAVEPFDLADLLSIVQRVGPCPIYGWKFLDPPDMGSFPRWSNRLSLDWHAAEDGGLTHVLLLFQEAGDELLLDLCFWFDELVIRRRGVEVISIDEFGAGGKRWWDGLHAGDQRTEGLGIYPLKADDPSAMSEIVERIRELQSDEEPENDN